MQGIKSKGIKAIINDFYAEGYLDHKDYKKLIKDYGLETVSDDELATAHMIAETLKKSENIRYLQENPVFENVNSNVMATRDLPLDNPASIQGFIDVWKLQNYARFWGNKYQKILSTTGGKKTDETILDIAAFTLANVHHNTKKFFWTADMIDEAYSMPMPEHNVTKNLVDDNSGYLFVFEKPVRLQAEDTKLQRAISHDTRWVSIIKTESGLHVSNDGFNTTCTELGNLKKGLPPIVHDEREALINSTIFYDAEYPKDFWTERSPNIGTLVMALLNFLHSTATITKSGRNTRANIRRAKKQGIMLQKQADVNVVYLRPTKYNYDNDDYEPTRKNKSYKGRFNVRGHWRNYWVGKGRTRRELRYVHGFQKGSGNLLNKIHIVNR